MPESKPNTFSKGLHMDVDPRLQPKDTYRDAMNIKVIDTEGLSLSIENTKGFTDIIDLDEDNTAIASAGAEIVGYYSFADMLVVMVVDGTASGTDTTVRANTRTKIFMFKDTGDGTYTSVYGSSGALPIYTAALEMDSRIPVKIVGSHENDTVRRIYWTDNLNPTRTINLEYGAYGLSAYPITTTEAPVNKISLTPEGVMNAPHLSSITSGSLPVGMYQYCYKYVTKDGGESGISPMSNLYHTTNNDGTTYKEFYGGEPGEESGMGFNLSVKRLDTTYDKIVIYAIQHLSKDGVSKACKVGERSVSSSEVRFTHNKWEDEVDITTVLEQGNTWDVCQDLAAKDNILFALNTQDRDSIVKSSEFDSKLKRWNAAGTASQETRWDNSGAYERSDQEGTYRYLPSKMDISYSWRDATQNIAVNKTVNVNVLGAQSDGYSSGKGVRVSFVSRPKVSDEQKGQPEEFPFIGADDTNPTFSTSLSGGGTDLSSTGASSNKDPQRAGSWKGYQRGEIYRFGILFYDKAGNPGNVLWMGDVQMPFQHDRSAEIYDDSGTEKVRPTQVNGNTAIEDFRLDTVDGLSVPSFVENDSVVSSVNKKANYLKPVVQTTAGRAFKHYTFDLMVRFDVKLPQTVKDKISGYRIVRAERSETERSVLHQGLYAPAVKQTTPGYTGAFIGSGTNSAAYDGYVGASNTSNADAVAEALTQNRKSQFIMMDTILSEEWSETIGGNTTNYDKPRIDNEHAQTSSVNEKSTVFGTLTNLAYGPTGAQWFVRGSRGSLYSPDNSFGAIPYSAKTGDKFRCDSVVRLIDNETISNQYYLTHLYGSPDGVRRFYGKKTLAPNHREGFIGKTYTFDTQFFHTVDNITDGWKLYCGNVASSGSTSASNAHNYYSYTSDIIGGESLNPGDSFTYSNGEQFKNISIGCSKTRTINSAIAGIVPYNAKDGNTNIPGYEGNMSIQKGNRCIAIESDSSSTGRLTVPPLARCIVKNTLAIPDVYRTQKMPYYILGSITRDNSSMYGGVSDDSLASTRYIAAGDFIDTNNTIAEYENIVAGGDVFVSIYSHQLTMAHYHPDHTAARWITFPVESMVNTDMRSGKHLGAGDMVGGFESDILPNRNDFLYNEVYSQENNLKGFIALDETKPYGDLENPRQVAYSNTKISGDYEDAWRRFPTLQFHDLDARAGKGVALVNWRDELYTLQERGLGRLFVNSRTLIGGSEGILLGSAKTIENHKYITTEYGSLHRDSVVSTDGGIYFVDAKNEKIVRYSGELDALSDTRGMSSYMAEVLKNGTTLKDLDATIYNRIPDSQFTVGRGGGIAAGYDPKTRRVYFTFLDTISSTSVKNTIIFNEKMNAFESKLGYYPALWMSVNGRMLTPSNALYTEPSNGYKLREVDSSASSRANFGPGHNESYVEVVVNDGAVGNKKFDGVEIYGDELGTTDSLKVTKVDMSTENTANQTITFATDAMHKVREGVLRFPLRAKTATKRLIGNYAKVKITSDNTNGKFSIFAIVSKIRQSFK